MNVFSKKNAVSKIINSCILLCMIYTTSTLKLWKEKDRIIANDFASYYLYLPAAFIYHDITLQYADTADKEVFSKTWYNISPINKRVGKMSCGLALLFSPFFLVSHAYTKLTKYYSANGYTLPYRFGLIVSALFYFGLGLYYLRKILNLYFSELITCITCIAISFGTNLYFYTIYEPAMTHVFNFALITAFIYHSIQWYKTHSLKLAILLGLLIGLISLTRPTNVIVILFFFFWDVKSISEFQERIKFWFSKLWILLILFVFAFIIWIPQFAYWKITTGSFLYYSYGDNEKFFFNNPIIIGGLFSYRKGWLLYTPVMTFALIGIFLLRKRLAAFFIPLVLFTILNIYFILSWWCWWYGGSFGARAFIDSYGLLAIPLAAFLLYIFNKSKKIFTGTLCLVIACIYLNQFQSYQYYRGFLHWDSMTKEAYWKNFCNIGAADNYYESLETPDYEAASKGIGR